ncbi:hypothetical protein E3N84_09480 [Terrimesophilobacter mesophilus]|uniref:Uncharacterized protein n=2 Tax=Terrimesophilobacter mesophilus TaxID=433647 RepID=A0A4R8VDM1_9MICO|nr:hypothetical protein E3N84_09480 [Terrimesophilobacter mesophilus]
MAATLSSSVTPPGVSYTATAADGYIPASSGGTVTIVFHFLVGFDSASGSLVADQIVDDGDAATEPPAPTRGGYEFTGWHLGTTSGALWNFATPITAPTTLVAGWTVQTELAATGADTSGLAGLAWLLLLTGAAAVTVRRRHPADRPK